MAAKRGAGRKSTSRKKSTGRKKSSARKKKARTRTYGAESSRKVKRAMHEMHAGKLTSGRSDKKVTSRKQAVAIGLSEARAEGAKVPSRRKNAKR